MASSFSDLRTLVRKPNVVSESTTQCSNVRLHISPTLVQKITDEITDEKTEVKWRHRSFEIRQYPVSCETGEVYKVASSPVERRRTLKKLLRCRRFFNIICDISSEFSRLECEDTYEYTESVLVSEACR